MESTETELAALRAEMAEMRRDLDRALQRLDLPHSKDREEPDWEWANMEFKQVNVRYDRRHIPVILYCGDDESGVFLYDEKMGLRGQFIVWADGRARLEILNAERKVIVSIGEGEDGRGEVRVNDADGTTRAGMKVSEHGGAVSVVTPEGKPLAVLASDESGGKVFICSPQTVPMATLSSTAEGGRLDVNSPLGKSMATLVSRAQGGLLALAEPGGQVMTSVIVTESGAALNVYGEQGVPVVTLSGLGELGGVVMFSNADGSPRTMLPDGPGSE